MKDIQKLLCFPPAQSKIGKPLKMTGQTPGIQHFFKK